MFTFREVTLGTQECKLELKALYADKQSRNRFEMRWSEFIESDPTNSEVFGRQGTDIITFLTESLIPKRIDNRPPVLLLLGNPASHSVLSGMCFAFESNNREHRFWVALRNTGVFEFFSDKITRLMVWHERNRIRKDEFFNLHYHSPFRIGITVFFSMPSAASDPKWSGVNGLIRLFGRKAIQAIALEEQRRIASLIQEFMMSRGGIITFQKDAYENVRSSETLPYSIKLAKKGRLRGKFKYDHRIYLVGAPPTRFFNGINQQSSLAYCKDYLVTKLF